MSGEADDQAEKEHDASQKRLDDARARGEVPHSQDLTAAAGLAGFTLAAAIFGTVALQNSASAGAIALEQVDRMSSQAFSGGTLTLRALFLAMMSPLLPFFLVPAVAAVLAILAQGALVFAPEKLMPKLSRVSPLAIAKQKFGWEGLFTFLKSTAKLCMVSAILILFMSYRLGDVTVTLYLSPAQTTQILLRLTFDFLLLVLLVTTVVGGVDYFWQRAQHARKLRMSRQEMIDEHKESDGDPHAKASRRQRGYDIAMNTMLADVVKADVVIVNPTHYAVALKWARGSKKAPICVAKGVDEVATRIREQAAKHGIPIHSDPPTARTIHATVELGDQIRPQHFRAVAAAIRFAEAMRKKARQKGTA